MGAVENLEFAWAKACALISPSPEEDYGSNPARYQDPAALGALLAPEKRLPEGPGVPLWLEKQVDLRFHDNCRKVLGTFPTQPPPILILSLGRRDLTWLKGALAALVRGSDPPSADRLGPGSRLNPEAWPDLAAVTARSVYRGVGPATRETLAEAYLDLDNRYQASLVAAAGEFDEEDGLARELGWEASAEEALTALRLRFDFGWDRTRPWGSLVQKSTASEVFTLPADRREPWDSWTFGNLLAPEPGTPWAPDPVVFEANLRRQAGNRGRLMFRSKPGTVEGLFGFLRWKEAETALWRTRIEALPW